MQIMLSNPFLLSRLRQRLTDLRPRLFRMASAWCSNPQQADDLVQEAMVKALKKLNQVKDHKAFDAWVFTILTNCFRDACRRPDKMAELEHEPVDELQPSAEDRWSTEQKVLQVRRAISRLGQGQREVLMLVDLEGFSYAEVAHILELPIGTVMSRLNRARQRLKALLTKPESIEQNKTVYLERVK